MRKPDGIPFENDLYTYWPCSWVDEANIPWYKRDPRITFKRNTYIPFSRRWHIKGVSQIHQYALQVNNEIDCEGYTKLYLITYEKNNIISVHLVGVYNVVLQKKYKSR